MTTNYSFAELEDCPLLDAAKRLAIEERHAIAALLRALMEIDTRRLYLGEGCASMFTYCTQVLHMAEGAAYNRIEAARAARRYPIILQLFEESAVTLTAIRLLAPHLTDANHATVLASARHRSKREIEELVAGLRPQPDVPVVLRKLPPGRKTPIVSLAAAPSNRDSPGCVAAPAALRMTAEETQGHPEPPHAVRPLAPERYRIQFTVSRETHERFRRAQALLRHAIPSGDSAEIFDRALILLVEKLEHKRFAEASRPRASKPSEEGSATFRQPSVVLSGPAMAAAARSSALQAAAVRLRFSSSTMWTHMRQAAPQRWRTFSYAAARTTSTRRGCSSGGASCGKTGLRGGSQPTVQSHSRLVVG
jgi:hypothetical protein